MRLLILLVLAACDNLSGGKSVQPDLTSKGLNHVPVVMTPHFGMVKDHCLPSQIACTHTWEKDGVRYADVFAEEPEDFNDYNRTETLGHECWHGFGARHK